MMRWRVNGGLSKVAQKSDGISFYIASMCVRIWRLVYIEPKERHPPNVVTHALFNGSFRFASHGIGGGALSPRQATVSAIARNQSLANKQPEDRSPMISTFWVYSSAMLR